MNRFKKRYRLIDLYRHPMRISFKGTAGEWPPPAEGRKIQADIFRGLQHRMCQPPPLEAVAPRNQLSRWHTLPPELFRLKSTAELASAHLQLMHVRRTVSFLALQANADAFQPGMTTPDAHSQTRFQGGATLPPEARI
ncbi:hypothetical protein [Desulfoluna sp.]|uniref:hypothetical protein n=1 Tax=Desulfoluna sp. TaxID=2045199 RepID=UPI00262F5B80|nr:hypothetical protein [Desulfoluna sp.]